MRRFFGQVDEVSKIASFSQETIRHIKVIRLNKKERFEVVSNGEVFLCQVEKIDPFTAVVVEKIKDDLSRELDFDLILFCPLLKRTNFELVLQKSVELGVREIYPYISDRVIKRVDKDEFAKKSSRYMKIIEGAVEQSNRICVPKLHDLSDLDELVSVEADRKFIAYENEALKGKTLPDMRISKGERIVCLIGPEGGFSSAEVDLFSENGFLVTSLGKRILRAETAAIYMLSILSYQGEKEHE